MQRLSARRWVSMAVERALEVSPTSLTTFLQSDQTTASNFQKELNMGANKFRLALTYMNEQVHEQEFKSKQASDVFLASTPGASSLEELEESVDLGKWRLKLEQRLVTLEVNTASCLRTISLRFLLMC